jgi:hypothetical protein
LGIILLAVHSLGTASALLENTTPYVPNPTDCTIAPRAIPSPPSASAEASPFSTTNLPPAGAPARSETVAEITDVVRGSIACTNAGDLLRALAYFTDGYVAQMISSPEGGDFNDFLQYLATPVAPLDESQLLAIIDISDVRQHTDALVSAIVTTASAESRFVDVLYFSNVGGRWLIAGSSPVETVDATPSP